MLQTILKRKGEKDPEEESEDEFEGKDLEEGEGEEEEIEGEDEEEEEKKTLKSVVKEIVQDVIIAFVIVMIIIGAIYLYTGNWPPVVVVESKSMQHSNDESFLGVIDTGDLVLVKSIESEKDVVSYMKGKRIGHETYSEYGDVLIYQKNGYGEITPVIHRAIVWLEYNETSNSFDIPELKYKSHEDDWYVDGGPNRWYNLSGTIVLREIGHDDIDVRINLRLILNNYQNQRVEPHSGFITLGDNNGGEYDQGGLQDGRGGIVQPVIPEWIVGKARGELPWFGLIKLYFQNPKIRDYAPANSWTMLFVSIALIFAVPICIDVILILMDRRREKLEKEKEEEEEEEEEPGEGEEKKGEGAEELEEEDEMPYLPEDLFSEDEPEELDSEANFKIKEKHE